MALTTTEMVDEVIDNLGNRTDVSRTRIVRHLNIAQRQLVRARPGGWKSLNGLADRSVSNTGNDSDRFILLKTVVPLDATTARRVRVVYSVRVIDATSTTRSRKLIRKHWRTWDRAITFAPAFSRNLPSHYTMFRDTVEIFPLPDATYTLRLRYSLWPIDINETSVTETELEGQEDLLILKTSANLEESLGLAEKGARFLALYDKQLARVIDEEQEDPDIEYGEFDDATTRHGDPDYWVDPFVRGVV